MDIPRGSETGDEKVVKQKIPYHTLLMVAIGDVRNSLAYGDPLPSLEALWAILPPEIRREFKGEWTSGITNMSKRINSVSRAYERMPSWDSKKGWLDKTAWASGQVVQIKRHFCGELLARIVEVLDDNGLLREFRREEIGGL